MEKDVKNKRRIGLFVVCIMTVCSIMNINKKIYAEQGDYLIKVNVAANCITIYEKGTSGEYDTAVKSFSCSLDETTLKSDEVFMVTAHKDWKQMKDGTFSKYVVELSNGISICSSPYTAKSNDTLDMGKFNGIGFEKAIENIWLCSTDAKWIFENCVNGSNVIFYSDSNTSGPLGKPDTIKLNENSKFTNWDPTDDDENNPWKNSSARIEGVKDIEINAGEDIDLFKTVKGYDICGNDVTKNIIIMGSYDLNKEGNYTITYYLNDATGSQVNKSANINVKKGKNIQNNINIEDNTGTQLQTVESKSRREKLEIIIGIGITAFFVAFMIIRYTKKY